MQSTSLSLRSRNERQRQSRLSCHSWSLIACCSILLLGLPQQLQPTADAFSVQKPIAHRSPTTSSSYSLARRTPNLLPLSATVDDATDSAATTKEDTASASSDKDDDGNYDDTEKLIDLGVNYFAKYFKFPLDDWQLQAGGALLEDHNVIVCAPTGAGKTVVGEMALWHAYSTNRNGIYTTPLKALSNQKYSELCQSFGRSETGLSTGDVSINKGARMTVMTTEVYRNIAWRSSTPVTDGSNDHNLQYDSVMGLYQNELSENAVVVLDEFHYMGQPGRGGVWEECVITSPAHTQIVGLSATLANAPALAKWMTSVTGRRTVLVEVPGQERPVPLRYMFATKDGLYSLFRDPDAGPGAPKGLLGLRGDGGKEKGFQQRQVGEDDEDDDDWGGGGGSTKKLPRGLEANPALKKAAEKRLSKVNRHLEAQQSRHRSRTGGKNARYGNDNDNDVEDGWGGGASGRKRVSYKPSGKLSPRDERRERERLLKNEMRKSVPSLSALLNRLQQKDLLPAIFFIFSRAGCDEAAQRVYLYMKGPTVDPNTRVPDPLFGDGSPPVETERKRSPQRKQGRKRNLSKNDGGDLVEDKDGRSFRPQSNYLSEATLSSLLGTSDLLDADAFDASSPLSSSNWDYYTKAGLLDSREVRDVASRISRFNDDNEEIAFDDEIIEQYLFGIGSHHAGMLPAHKSFVEILYRNQLMKVVFATETLAAGINMPARTTVVCALAKRGDNSAMNLLETSNLLQMAGRAGRRGMDTDGTCVIVATPFESHDDAAKILTDPIKPITSQFSPSYSLAVNLVARGEGKLDVARQLVSKSFAMWEKRQVEEKISDAVESHGEGVSEVLQASAQERFMAVLGDALQLQVDSKKATFDIAKVQTHLDILNDRESLKKASKSYIGSSKMLELEQTTLGYLEKEYTVLRAALSEEYELLGELAADDANDILDQIKTQQERAVTTEKEVSKHPFTSIANIVNEIMKEDSSAVEVLRSALKSARETDENALSFDLTAKELAAFAKSAVVIRRKTRKLAKANPGLDPESLLKQADKADVIKDDSWIDMLAITKVLVAYGCLSTETPFSENAPLEKETFTLTPAGINIGMLGLGNSLWCLAAMGGAWDVVGASVKLDKFRDAMNSFDDDDAVFYVDDEEEERANNEQMTIPKPQQEAETLVSLLRDMSPSEVAGYVASLITDSSRGGQTSVVDLFQQLSPLQQRVTQSSLFVMERLTEVQKQFNVDENTRNCILDISNCEVVTAWAEGCSWSEALEISGSPPGDLARILSRVLDATRQFGNLPFSPLRRSDMEGGSSGVETESRGIHPEVRRLCRDAAKAINRYPVKDPLVFASDEDDEDIDKENLDDTLNFEDDEDDVDADDDDNEDDDSNVDQADDTEATE